jgi:hypothetical protein
LSTTRAHTKSPLITRRSLVKGAAGVAVLGGGAAGAIAVLAGKRRPLPKLLSFSSAHKGPVRRFVSRPDLRPPSVTVSGAKLPGGYLFLGPGASGEAQAGPLMLDENGEPAWFQPISRALWLSNFRRAHYRGRPALTWWEGAMTTEGFGRGEGVIVDSAYRELARVRAGNGRYIDVHEFLVTRRGTALCVCYPETVSGDLSSIGGPTNGTIQESIVQEVDIASGRVLLEWRSLDHIGLDETYQRPAAPIDYFHANSVAVAPDGNLLLSARCTWALYKLDRHTGSVIWRLGGKRSDFRLENGAQFSWQHDARWPHPATITLFDDGEAAFDDGSGMSDIESQSRGIVLKLDEARRTVSLARSYRHPRPLLANAMGSFQTLPDGNVLLGWGSSAVSSEFSGAGKLLTDWTLGAKNTSYRAYRYEWAGQPASLPAIAARRTGRHASTLYVSWNGATTVTHWMVHAGSRPGALQPVGIASRRGFETVIPLRIGSGYVQVSALDRTGRRLATSKAVRL